MAVRILVKFGGNENEHISSWHWGFFGAIIRYLISEWLPITNGFPIATFIINLSGCLFLAWFLQSRLNVGALARN
ncbi:CrcB family protein [Bacillus sp. N9]